MSKIHIVLTNENEIKLRNYCKANDYNLSQGINSLIEVGLDNLEYKIQSTNNYNLLSKIYSKNIYIIDLLEKLYSDLEIDNNTNPKDNKSLQEFKINKMRDKFDD